MNQSKSHHIDLSEVSDKFTKDTLTDVLCKAQGKKVQLIDWDVGEGFAKGDSYLSVVTKVTVYGITDDDSKQHVQVNVVIKSIPKNVGRRKTFRSSEFFSNEIEFYTQASISFIYFSHNYKCVH